MVSCIRSFLLLVFSLFAPINFYLIGDSSGFGIQSIFFRYQKTYLGDNFITIVRDAEYVIGGIVGSRTALSYSIWVVGALIIVASLIILFSDQESSDTRLARISGLLIMVAGALFLLSCIVQYGPLFHGPSGLSIPFGVPLIILIGYLLYAGFPGITRKMVNMANPERVVPSAGAVEEEA